MILEEAINLIENEYYYVIILDELNDRKKEITNLFQFKNKSWLNENITNYCDGESPSLELCKVIKEHNMWDLALYNHVEEKGGLLGKVLLDLKKK